MAKVLLLGLSVSVAFILGCAASTFVVPPARAGLGEVQPVDAVVVGIERLSHPDPGPLDNQADRVFSFG